MVRQPEPRPLEMWGGLESTVNRVGDRYLDQLERSGHVDRLDDLDRFAGLGIRALRYPILWERTAPDGPETADWSWPDERLGRLRELGLRPIVGLVHHGSGPRDTSLLDPAFPERLAAYAGAVAERYPWVEDYTPVNEPVTTARFAALYGHWYPHHADDLSFARALLTQCRAVTLAMRAIRAVNPTARLIQTDDLGKTHGTHALAYQVALENERRWLSFDLLAGRLTPDRPMWAWLLGVGIPEADLAWFLENPCPPDVVGINHYLSSERFLDERLDRYPAETPGGNVRHAYVDVLAARVLAGGATGPEALLGEAWERYGLPLAITEAHNGCTREEQLRWLDEVWRAAEGARRAGADVRAVTVWSLLGAFDWDRMVTRDDGHYEPGVFDLRAPEPRPTAIAALVRNLATGAGRPHPVLGVPGWWRHPDRLVYGLTESGGLPDRTDPHAPPPWSDATPLLLVGSGGMLTRAVGQACEHRHIPHRVVDLRGCPADPGTTAEAVANAVAEHCPWAVVDLGALDHRRGDGLGAPAWGQAGVDATVALAVTTAAAGIPLVVFSTDRVFDGCAGRPYVESDRPTPGDPAGRRQAAVERHVLAEHTDALVVRTGPLFGGPGEQDIVASLLRALSSGVPMVLPGDEVVSPSYASDIAEAALDLLIDGERGVWHLATPGAATWADVGRRVAALAGIGSGVMVREPTAAVRVARRSRVLESARGWLLPDLDHALARRVSQVLAEGDWAGFDDVDRTGRMGGVPDDARDQQEATGDRAPQVCRPSSPLPCANRPSAIPPATVS